MRQLREFEKELQINPAKSKGFTLEPVHPATIKTTEQMIEELAHC
jgi:hypothetical protein